jgi:hypothetical protein
MIKKEKCSEPTRLHLELRLKTDLEILAADNNMKLGPFIKSILCTYLRNNRDELANAIMNPNPYASIDKLRDD